MIRARLTMAARLLCFFSSVGCAWASTGTFQPAGGMAVSRFWHTATLLNDGSVLMAGGETSSDITATCELYNPSTRRFAATGSMNVPRALHTATLMPDGRVLIVGGITRDSGNNIRPVASAEIYNPSTGAFTATYGQSGHPLARRTATLIDDGTVLLTGGNSGPPTQGTESLAGFPYAETFDPATETFRPTADMAFGRTLHSATRLSNGAVLVCGGTDGKEPSCETYVPATRNFVAGHDMVTSRRGHTAAPLGGDRVLLVGGAPDYNGNSVVAEIYDARANQTARTGDAVLARSVAVAVTLRAGIFIIGGNGPGGDQGLSTEIFSVQDGRFQKAADLPLRRTVGQSATLLRDGSVLIAGGAGSSGATADLFIPAVQRSRAVSH
jgi:hypothetical protein